MHTHRPAARKTTFRTLLLAMVSLLPLQAYAQTASSQLPTGGQVVAGQAGISQSGAVMNIDQTTHRAAINWQSFDIGSTAHVNFNQPSASSVTLNRVLGGGQSQILGNMTANGQVFLSNANGVYFARGASVNVGGLVATTHGISDADFMAGNNRFTRNGATGAVVNEGTLNASLGGYIALLAPEVRNNGVIIAEMGTVALAAGDAYELKFDGANGLADISVSSASIAALVENGQAVRAPGGLVIMSAQAANSLQGGVVRHSGSIEAGGLVNDGGVVRLVSSDKIFVGGTINADAAANGKGGKVIAIADLNNKDSSAEFSGHISARGGSLGGDGGFVETSGSHFMLDAAATVDTRAAAGKTGDWLIDPYDYNINGAAATSIVNSLATSNVEVSTAVDNAAQGSNGNGASTGNLLVSSAINSGSANMLTLTAANAITLSAAVSTGALTLNGPGGITLNNDISTRTAMTFNGNITLGNSVTLTSGVSNTYNANTSYVVPVDVTSITATLVGGAGGRGGIDTSGGGAAGTVGMLTASFAVTSGQTLYIAPGSGGAQGGDQVTNTGGGAGGTNQFNLGNGGIGGNTGPVGNSGGGGGGGAATLLTLTATPNSGTAMLVAGGGGGGGGSGNNTACPSLCGDQSSANYRNDSVMTGQTGYHAGNQGAPINDGGGSGGGGGGVAGGVANQSVFFVNEWTGRGANAGSSGAANGFATTSLSTSVMTTGESQNGYAIISYGGGLVDINGTVNGAHNLNIVARSSSVNIQGAVGGNTALASLNVTGAQGIAMGGGAVTTTGAQTYTGPVTLGANNNTFTSTSNGNVIFGGDIVKGSGVTGNLSVNAGAGNVSLNGQTGTTGTPIGAINIASTGTTTLAGAVYGTSLAKTGAGKTTVSGGLVRTTGSQSYANILDLGGNAQLISTGTGDITLSAAVSNSNQSNLTINAAGGNVTAAGNFAVGTNSRPTPIGDVSITASGTVTLGSSGTPISIDAKSLSVTANIMTAHADTGTAFTCNTGASASGFCLGTSTAFSLAAASTLAGPITGTTTLAKSGAGALTMTGNHLYTGNTTVNGGKLDISGAGSLGAANSYGGNVVLNGGNSQIRFSTSANQTMTGTVSGTGFINSPGTGSLNITTQAGADFYNLATLYIVPTSSVSGGSSLYGSAPTFSYQLATTAGGGTAITDADPSGTATLTGTPTNTSSVGNYTVSYGGGLTIGNERYATVTAGNNLAWTIAARPLTLTVSKVYDGAALFSNGFAVSGMVNSDAAPTLTGSASVASTAAGSYNSFASSTLAQGNSNYTLTGATVNATISKRPLNISVSKPYDGITSFSQGFTLVGMIGADTPTVTSGIATVASMTAGTYNSFTSNGLVLSDANYTLTGGTVSATIAPAPPAIAEVTAPSVPPVPETAPKAAELSLPGTNTPSSSTSETSQSAPAQNQSAAMAGPSTGATTTTSNGIVISTVREPSVDVSGVITVSIPKEVSAKTGGFSFPLPEQAATKGTAAALMVKTSDGKDLPGWLKFNASTKTFTAASVPVGGLPLSVVVFTNGTKTTITISEGA